MKIMSYSIILIVLEKECLNTTYNLGVGKWELLYTAGRHLNWWNHFGSCFVVLCAVEDEHALRHTNCTSRSIP